MSLVLYVPEMSKQKLDYVVSRDWSLDVCEAKQNQADRPRHASLVIASLIAPHFSRVPQTTTTTKKKQKKKKKERKKEKWTQPPQRVPAHCPECDMTCACQAYLNETPGAAAVTRC